ncbi:MAG: acetate/propionate family kinase [Pseudomonadota bacterium]
MTGGVLVLNAGSSSVKFAVYEREGDGVREAPDLKGHISGIGGANTPHSDVRMAGEACNWGPPPASGQPDVLKWIVANLRDRSGGAGPSVAGHRIVHGGPDYSEPVLIDDDVVARLEALTPLAPNHQPHNLAGVAAVASIWPDLPQVACFDTAFHRTQPSVAQAFALPRRLTEAGVLRYGFHGLSYAFIAGRLPEVLGDRADGRVIVAHLGHGASLCAMKARRSVATTMGFTALDGLPMGKRCGDLDPGVVLHLLQGEGMSVDEVAHLLNKESGLLGVSGVSDDMRDLLESTSAHAREAVDLFVYRAVREIGSMAAALGGLDALVFTAGIGENASEIRRRICEGCAWLGVRLDAAANARNAETISEPGSDPRVLVLATDEEAVIAASAARLLG